MITRVAVVLLLVTNIAVASILSVRRPIVIQSVTAEERGAVAHAIATVAKRHGLEDRTFIAPDHRIFAMFEGHGRVIATHDADGVSISFTFDARNRDACDSIRDELVEVLGKQFGPRMKGRAEP